MNINRALPHHLTASSLLALAILSSLPQAQAFQNDHLLPLNQGPDWAVYLDNNCSATQITAHVAISTATCVNGIDRLMYPKINGYVQSPAQAQYQGEDRYGKSIGNVGLAFAIDVFDFFETELKPATILSYQQEKQSLVDGDDTLTTGAKLSMFSSTPGNDLYARNVTYTDWYWKQLGPQAVDGRPLIYRSVSKYRELEPKRFWGNNWDLVMPLEELDYFYTWRRISDKRVDSRVLLTSGRQNNLNADNATPNTPTDTGGGIFYKAPDGKLGLVGVVSATTAHVRLSHFWPWVYQSIMEKGLRSEAIAFSRKVLGTGIWGSNDLKGKIGDVFLYDNPYTRDVEFFRLIGLSSDQRYWYFPTNKSNNKYWQYLGTTLPNMDQVTTPLHSWGQEVNSRMGNIDDVYLYANPFSNQVEYFRLLTAERYDSFPINQTTNAQWQYLGSDPTTAKLPPPTDD